MCKVVHPKRNHSGDDEDNQDLKPKRRHNSRDRYSTRDKHNKSESRKYEELKIGAPYYSGGIAAIERESGEETSNDEDDDTVGQRYYSTETADSQRKNSESYWNKYAKKQDRKQDVCT